MSEKFFICRCWLDRSIGKSRFKYITDVGGWTNTFDDACGFDSREAAQERLNGRNGSIWPGSELKASAYYLAEMKSQSEARKKISPELRQKIAKAAAQRWERAKAAALHPAAGFTPEEYLQLSEADKNAAAQPLKNCATQSMKSPKTEAAVEVLPPIKIPKLDDGSDKDTSKRLNKMFSDAQTGMRKIISLGLFAWEIKEAKLKHGEFGAWLSAHCPKLVTIGTVTQKPKPSRSLQGYMELTKNVLESAGITTIERYLETVVKCANAAHLKPGGFLLIADKKVPEDIKEVREKICAIVDGKTQRQLFLEFKQADDDTGRPKLGRLKGQGGATKAQRASAQERDYQERITERKLKALEIAEWLTEMSDDKGLGEIFGTPELIQLDVAMETARGYIRHGSPLEVAADLNPQS